MSTSLLYQAFGRQPLAQVSGMPRLAAGFAARRLLANRRGRLRWVRRRRDRRVGSILSEPRFQVADARIEFGDPFQQRSTSWATRLVHAVMLTSFALASCATLTR